MKIILSLYVLGMVFNVLAEVASLSSIRVSWNNFGISDITDFVIYYRQTCRLSPTEMMTSVPFSQNSVLIANLIEDTQYIFEVTARVIEDGKELIGDRGTSKPVELSTISYSTASVKPDRTSSYTGISYWN